MYLKGKGESTSLNETVHVTLVNGSPTVNTRRISEVLDPDMDVAPTRSLLFDMVAFIPSLTHFTTVL